MSSLGTLREFLLPNKIWDVGTFERTSRRFCNAGCCCCFSLFEVFRFHNTFSCHQYSTLTFQTRVSFHQIWGLPWLVLVVYFCQVFFTIFSHFTASTTILRRLFSPKGAFYPLLLPHIFAHLWLKCEQKYPPPNPGSSPIHKIIPSSKRKSLNYWFRSYKIVVLLIKFWSIKYRVNKFLAAWCLVKIICKEYKTTWTSLFGKYSL